MTFDHIRSERGVSDPRGLRCQLCRDALTSMNGSIRVASGILMMLDLITSLREICTNPFATCGMAPFATSFGTYDDRFEFILQTSLNVSRSCSTLKVVK